MEKSIKRIISLLFMLIIGSSLMMQSVAATDEHSITSDMSNEYTNNDTIIESKCQKVAEDFFEKYYGYYYGNENKESLEKIYDTYFESNELKEYLSLTIYSSKNGRDDVTDFFTEVSPIEYNMNNSLIWVKCLVTVKFKYTDCETYSGITRTAQLVIDTSDDEYKINDCYINDISNIEIRGDIENIGFSDVWEDKSVSKQYVDKAKARNPKNSAKISSTNNYSNLELMAEDRGITTVQRQKIATYAINNCDVSYPQSGNSNYTSYVDFVSLGGFDCTNFASHCLLAGGAIPVDTGGNGISSTGWYFRNINNRSSSWSGVDYFYNFLVNNSGSGPKGEHRSFAYNCPQNYLTCSLGDFIQINYENDTTYNHTTIVTSIAQISDYAVCPRITSRTGYNSGYSANNNVLITDTSYINVNYSRRVIHITSM